MLPHWLKQTPEARYLITSQRRSQARTSSSLSCPRSIKRQPTSFLFGVLSSSTPSSQRMSDKPSGFIG